MAIQLAPWFAPATPTQIVDTPTGGRTAANWCQQQIAWNPEKKRVVGRVGRKDNENCNRVERSAGCGVDWDGVDKSRVSGGGAARSGEEEPGG
eukprot:667113-Pyramimonas_sp.AAC.1